MIDPRTLKGLTSDSRAVKPGYLFAALPGAKADGHSFIQDAIRNGATHILGSSRTTLPAEFTDRSIQLIQSENPRLDFARLAAAFYGSQPKTIVAVTGTNGKTSTAVFTQQIWEALGHKSASIGTLGVRGSGLYQDGTHTTPDPVALHALLAELEAGGVTHTAMEASSHGLDQFRLDGVHLRAAGFTNLTRDHLDYHGTMEVYKAAKLRLFTEVLLPGGLAVLNADVPEFAEFSQAVLKAGRKVLSYGKNASDIKILKAEPVAEGQHISLLIDGRQNDFILPLIGEFQVYNALCALGLTLPLPHPALPPMGGGKRGLASQEALAAVGGGERMVTILKSLKGVPGRMQSVAGHPKGAGVYVDYAHTPDALENVLNAARPHTSGKLVCLMGCGGDRDKGKRPQMGKAACDLADHVIVTDDNPRSEVPEAIRANVLAGCHGSFEEISGRAVAIKHAIKRLHKGDVLIIAGKGHEQGQIFADRTEPFDDVQEAAKSIKEI